jgi:hypothetical protein
MSEHARPTHEQKETLTHIDTKELSKRLEHARSGEIAGHQAKESLSDIRSAVEKATAPVESAAHATEGTNDSKGNQQHWWSSEFKVASYKQTMGRVRKHLSPTERMLSKAVHQPVVERVSEVGSKTIARPSGILIGAVLSFVGSSIAYILTKRYGYNLPNSIYSILFISGFAIGIIGELSYKTLRNIFNT